MQIDNNNEECPEEPCGKPLTNCEDDAVVIPSGNAICGCITEGADNYNPDAVYQCELCTYCDQLTVTWDLTHPSNDITTDGAINLYVNGGTPVAEGEGDGYSYIWTDGVTTQDRSAITSGLYICEVTDAGGCIKAVMIVLNAANSTTYGCINATPGDFPDVNGEDNNGVPCSYPCEGGYLVFNYDPASEISDGSCIETGCTDSDALNYATGQQYDCLGADVTVDSWVGANGWNSCCTYCVDGCTDPNARNYDPALGATCDDGSCLYYWRCFEGKGGMSGCIPVMSGEVTAYLTQEECNAELGNDCGNIGGCTDTKACNFNTLAQYDNGDCTYECIGCHDASACNYDQDARIGCEGNLCCTYINYTTDPPECDCDGNIADECGVCNGAGPEECGCGKSIPKAKDGDGRDVTVFCDCLGNQLDDCELCGILPYNSCFTCTDQNACNYVPYEGLGTAMDDGSCLYNDTCGICGGPGDNDDCGGCDPDNVYAFINGSSDSAGYTINGAGVFCDCDGNEDDACGFCNGSVDSLVAAGSAVVGDWCGCDDEVGITWTECGIITGDCSNTTVIVPEASAVSGNICNCQGWLWDDCMTCVAPNAAFFEADFNITGNPCDCEGNTFGVCTNFCVSDITPPECITNDCQLSILDCAGVCGGGQVVDDCDTPICGGDNSTCTGCTNPLACNYDSSYTFSDNTQCTFVSCYGCMDPDACNTDETATQDDGSCAENDECGVCGGGGIPSGDCDCDGNTLDACGVCGGDSTACAGCTNITACNYSGSSFTIDDGSCEYTSCAGCTDDTACNYDPTATIANGSCLQADVCGECGGTAQYADNGVDILPSSNGGYCNCGVAPDFEGSLEYDFCGICDGDVETDPTGNDNFGEYCDCADENGDINGNPLTVDECGTCNGGGYAATNQCGENGCGDFPNGGCNCNGDQLDECGVCGGNGIAAGFCDCDSSIVMDQCGGCDTGLVAGDNPNDPCSCTGYSTSWNYVDECGVCGGTGIPEGDCNCHGDTINDCGICGGNGEELIVDSSGNYIGNFENGLPTTVAITGGGTVGWAVNTSSPIVGLKDGLLTSDGTGTSAEYPRLVFGAALVIGQRYVLKFHYRVNSGTCILSSVSTDDWNQNSSDNTDLQSTQLPVLAVVQQFVHYFTAVSDPGDNSSDAISLNFDGQEAFEVQLDNISVRVQSDEGDALTEGACNCDGQELDDCNVCGGGYVIPSGECDCEGNVEDLCGTCGGPYTAGSTTWIPPYYFIEDLCECPLNDDNALDSDGVVNYEYHVDLCNNCGGGNDACQGCMNPDAGNYDSSATVTGICYGCTDIAACNFVASFESGSISDDGSCTYIAEGDCNCAGDVLDECGICGGSGYAPGACDCAGNVADLQGVCGGDCSEFDECGVCNGPGAIYECDYEGVGATCQDMTEGDCDCLGNQLDECGECGDDNGYNASCTGCMDSDYCNFDATATIPCNSCCTTDCWGCTDNNPNTNGGEASNYDADATMPCIENGAANGCCTYPGCTNAASCNYDSTANLDDGSCTVNDECGICGGSGIPDGECDCDGNVLDECDICGGSGIPDGECNCFNNILDACGVCGGPAQDTGDNGIDLGTESLVCSCNDETVIIDACGDCDGGVTSIYHNIFQNDWSNGTYPPSNDGYCDCAQTLTYDYGPNYTDADGIADVAGWEAAFAATNFSDEESVCDCMVAGTELVHHFSGPEDAGKLCSCSGSNQYYWDSCGACLSAGQLNNLNWGVFFEETTTSAGPDANDAGNTIYPVTTNALGLVACGCTPTQYAKFEPQFPDACNECGGIVTIDSGNGLYDYGINPAWGGVYCDCNFEQYDDCGVCQLPEDQNSTQDECGVCGGPGAVHACGCSGIPEDDCDCDGNVFDCTNTDCGGTAEVDECGVCGGDGAIYECGCAGIAEGECNCAGDVVDDCGVCGGTQYVNESTGLLTNGDCDCAGNVMGACGCGIPMPDGACDCNGDVLHCGVCGNGGICGCMDSTKCNYNSDATSGEAGSNNGVYYDGNCLVNDDCTNCGGDIFYANDTDDTEGYASDSIENLCDCDNNAWDDCDVCGGDNTSCADCMDTSACNYNALATVPCSGNSCCNYNDDCGVCGGNNSTCSGCTDNDPATNTGQACNFDPAATIDDGSCTYECVGCTDPLANNYDASATTQCWGDNSCCNYGYTCTEFVDTPAVPPQCDGVSVTHISNMPDDSLFPNDPGFADYMVQVHADDITDEKVYCIPLSSTITDDPDQYLNAYDGVGECAHCDLAGGGNGLRIGIMYRLHRVNSVTGLPAIPDIRTGVKGPTLPSNITSNSSLQDLFAINNTAGLNENVFLSMNLSTNNLQSLRNTLIPGVGADILNFAHLVTLVEYYSGGNATVKAYPYSCCCNSGSDEVLGYDCEVDPNSFATESECEDIHPCCLPDWGGTGCEVTCPPSEPDCDKSIRSIFIDGCTDSTADNYDSTATQDDGSCIYTSWACQDGPLIGNTCSDLTYMPGAFADATAVITHIADNGKISGDYDLQKLSFSLTDAKSTASSCYSVAGLQNTDRKVTHAVYSIKSLNITSGKGTVFAGNSWKALIKFLYNKKMSSVVEGTTYAEALVAIAASAYTDYTIGLTIAPCSCTYGPCSCVPDVNGTHTTQAACQQETTNCCT